MINAIAKRQSIRKYTNDKVSHEDLVKLLEAGFRAPTAMNKQPVKYVVVENKKALEEIYAFAPSYRMFDTAEAAIIVCFDEALEDRREFGFVDAAAAIENILLEAYEIGYGTCWCAIEPHKEKAQKFIDYFKIDKGIVPVGAIAIGKANESRPIEERYTEEKIKWVK